MNEEKLITSETKVLCVIGYPIGHSMSPIMHNAALKDLNLDYIYLAFNIKPEYLSVSVEGFRTFNFIGISVTMPFKQSIMSYLDEIESSAQRIGAVNTIKNDNGCLIGRNTDCDGALKAFIDSGYSFTGKNVLLLGAGGAARALAYIIAENANKIVIANRTKENAVKLANDIKKYFDIEIKGKINSTNVLKDEAEESDILINATSVGSYPNLDKSPIPSEFLHKDLIVYDIVYNPLKTRLMKDSEEIGCKVLGGIDMLVNQGILAFEWWTGRTPNKQVMKSQIIKYMNEEC